MDIGSFLAALALGLFSGAVARMLIPNDAFRYMRGWRSWTVSVVLGLIGALAGYFIFTEVFGIGDEDKFDWGGVLGAIIGSIIVVALASAIVKRVVARRMAERAHTTTAAGPPPGPTSGPTVGSTGDPRPGTPV
jgi:uncharacterized membrane protein YeaQ/YmgE (transglycosylase-associated protein family)